MLLAIVLGAGAGFAVIELGGSSDLSMAATFFGALAPVLWHLRENRSREGDSR